MEPDSSPEILLTHFDWNIQRLKEMLQQEASDYFRSASLQRFGLTGDSALKCLQAFAQQNGETCDCLDECVQIADKSEWVSLDDTWKGLISAHDKISRGSKEDQVELEIFQSLENYHSAFKELHTNLLKRV
jgi:hypothetical protein